MSGKELKLYECLYDASLDLIWASNPQEAIQIYEETHKRVPQEVYKVNLQPNEAGFEKRKPFYDLFSGAYGY